MQRSKQDPENVEHCIFKSPLSGDDRYNDVQEKNESEKDSAIDKAQLSYFISFSNLTVGTLCNKSQHETNVLKLLFVFGKY